ncbi:hypothetical protein ABPG74_007802 [Tetrahymena malaccensis]
MKLFIKVFIIIQIVSQITLIYAFKNKFRQDHINADDNSESNALSLSSGITIKPSNYENNSLLKLLSSESNYASFELLADTGAFKIENSSVSILEVSEGVFNILVDTKLENIYIQEDIINRQSDLKLWKLYLKDISNQNEEIVGWTDNSTSMCEGIFMLGGFNNFAKGEVKKIYENIPEHSQVRVVAQYHFIDQWMGEVGFMKINSHLTDNTKQEYVWVQKYDTTKINTLNPINVCGAPYPEYQLTFQIDIVVPHNKENIILSFGSTLETEDPAEASFGVSNIQIYLQ